MLDMKKDVDLIVGQLNNSKKNNRKLPDAQSLVTPTRLCAVIANKYGLEYSEFMQT